MKNQKNENGITLVALVVTIVVLLILAGITIIYVLSDNGIYGKARDAATETNWDNVKSTVGMALSAVQMEMYAPNGSIATATGADDAAITAAKSEAANTEFAKELQGSGVTAGTFSLTYVPATTGETATAAHLTGTGKVDFKGDKYDVNFDSSNGTFTVNGK